MKLHGLELEIEGARDDASQISKNLGEQFASLLQPVGAIIDGKVASVPLPSVEAIASPIASAGKKGRRRKSPAASAGDAETSPALDFKHDPEKFGNPTQEWKTSEKAVWLLYVVKESAGVNELTTRSLVDTFNKHFRQSGTITTSNVTRDLGRLKTREKPSPVGEDASKSVPTWYLTEEGHQTRASPCCGRTRSVSLDSPWP
jgi:hypothetical protein